MAGIENVANVIVGGGMIHCSSSLAVPSTQCSAPWTQILHDDPAFAGIAERDVLFGPVEALVVTYQVTPAAMLAFESLPERLLARDQLRLLAPLLKAQLGAGSLTAPQFFALLAGVNGQTLAAASEVFVERQQRPPRRRQLRSIAYTSDTDTAAIYRAFVAAAASVAGKKRPAVALVTASVDNPFKDHDLYLTALQSAGADVIWLPLDGGFRRALDAGDCEHLAIDYTAYAEVGTGRHYLHMDQVYPDLHALRQQACAQHGAALNSSLERIDGIFFTGGDQARHLDSLVSARGASAQLQILQRRYAAGQLVVGGSSAGDAVQAGGEWRGRKVPMIAGGESSMALAQGWVVAGAPVEDSDEGKASYYPGGGLGFFHYGPLDSHFSQRGREGRLTRLVAHSGMDYGFGVDENTALVVGRPDAWGATSMGVMGAGGVWVVDLRAARPSGAANGPFTVRNARIYYLHAGDRIRIDRVGSMSVILAGGTAAVPTNPSATTGFRLAALVEDMLRSGGEGNGTIKAATGDFAVRVYRAPGTQLARTVRGQLSYAGLGMDIAPAAPER